MLHIRSLLGLGVRYHFLMPTVAKAERAGSTARGRYNNRLQEVYISSQGEHGANTIIQPRATPNKPS